MYDCKHVYDEFSCRLFQRLTEPQFSYFVAEAGLQIRLAKLFGQILTFSNGQKIQICQKIQIWLLTDYFHVKLEILGNFYGKSTVVFGGLGGPKSYFVKNAK